MDFKLNVNNKLLQSLCILLYRYAVRIIRRSNFTKYLYNYLFLFSPTINYKSLNQTWLE